MATGISDRFLPLEEAEDPSSSSSSSNFYGDGRGEHRERQPLPDADVDDYYNLPLSSSSTSHETRVFAPGPVSVRLHCNGKLISGPDRIMWYTLFVIVFGFGLAFPITTYARRKQMKSLLFILSFHPSSPSFSFSFSFFPQTAFNSSRFYLLLSFLLPSFFPSPYFFF
jgi:hypothetical protein